MELKTLWKKNFELPVYQICTFLLQALKDTSPSQCQALSVTSGITALDSPYLFINNRCQLFQAQSLRLQATSAANKKQLELNSVHCPVSISVQTLCQSQQVVSFIVIEFYEMARRNDLHTQKCSLSNGKQSLRFHLNTSKALLVCSDNLKGYNLKYKQTHTYH